MCKKEVMEPSKKCWAERSQNNKKDKTDIAENEEEPQAEEKIKDDFKESLLTAIAKMSSKKVRSLFESFTEPYGRRIYRKRRSGK